MKVSPGPWYLPASRVRRGDPSQGPSLVPTQHILLKPPCHAQLSRIQEQMAPGIVGRGRVLASENKGLESLLRYQHSGPWFPPCCHGCGDTSSQTGRDRGDEWRMGRAQGLRSVLCPQGCQLAGRRLLPMWNWSLSGSHSLHPHCLHPHSVPHPVVLQEEREIGLEADLSKRERKCKQGSQREAVVLLPSPTCRLCSFCSLWSCLLSCPSHCLLIPTTLPPP